MPISRLLLALLAGLAAAPVAQAARFTYHGELMDGDAPAQGRYDLEVRAYPAPAGAKALGEAMVLPSVEVNDGRFAVELDLPEDADGMTWVQVAVRGSDSKESFTALGERQPISKANSTCPGAWALDGNTGLPAGSFLGIADPAATTALELRVKNSPVARFTPNLNVATDGVAPAVALGSSANLVSPNGATVSGGGSTLLSGVACPTCRNESSGNYATVGGGQANLADGNHATVAGGHGHVANGSYATVGGGDQNRTGHFHATVPGGVFNFAGGRGSFAAGTNAHVRTGGSAPAIIPSPLTSFDYTNGAADDGSFVWGDNSATTMRTSGPNQFLVRASGGVGINAAPPNATVELTVTSDADNDFPQLWLRQRAASNPGVLISAGDASGANDSALYIDNFNGSAQTRRLALNANGVVEIRSNTTGANTGVTMAANAGSWSSLSDRRLKTAIAAVDPVAILDRLLATPISTWSYKAQGEAVRHIGPMAQDFAASFNVGEHDTLISTVDADGVALAAIQGLNAKLESENLALRGETKALREQHDAVLQRLERLEARQER